MTAELYWPQKVYPVTAEDANHHKRVLFVCPLTPAILQDPTPLLHPLGYAASQATERCIVLFSTPNGPQLYPELQAAPKQHFAALSRFLAQVYSVLAAGQWDAGRPLTDVEVRFDGEDGDWALKLGSPTFVIGFEGLAADIVAKAAPNLSKEDRRFVQIEPELEQLVRNPGTISTVSEPGYPVAAMGGTFDHLHAAHKLLLHMALFATEQRLIVGVMADRLLATKSHADVLEGLDTRLGAAAAFLRRCGGDARGVVLDVVEIHDALGPTAWDPEVSLLVVSKETLGGGNYVNRIRGEKGLSILDMLAIDVISSEFAHDKRSTRDLSAVDDAQLKDAKMGSTGIREFIARQKQA
ncbi:hypothetical protein CcaverHIS002_0408360 [Cutaneotrichosporon cavernicola]|uniref:Cytidyltransferase-like domain-containing protein n=1 Tax=Cutaneotrichosporon cavernicola TaxID=279322 RepID=A0AA48QW47_9TREE|nr:uncharacterized protein CcaverHIS019_0408300 [Cutaneotrichosporon cavernicola]BEI84232.1 hypothetical protein CcaverHIS002_0408360 [Cutaneotrichosporon cavernicola]BEI92010.1 hypothetical protein CcaverHIS019_0408300 [Cutaneotrichosporon cavernicola]BEJ07556.1 hypothetical protein CcaverHIS641_0408250 [Cutaneotrichosporon cavernicola]